MSTVVRVADLSKNTITGLLGRNGAGKTTLLQILTGKGFESSGTVEVFGQHPYENDDVLSRVAFVKESQKFPDALSVRHVLRSARLLSRGMLSAVGVIIGLASRAPLTILDEPYLGLDAVARHLFNDRLLADYA